MNIESRIKSDQVTDSEAIAYEQGAEKVIFYPISDLPQHPEWSETYMVESKKTYQFLGFIGKIGWSQTYAYDDGLPNVRGRGRMPSKEQAIMALVDLAGAV